MAKKKPTTRKPAKKSKGKATKRAPNRTVVKAKRVTIVNLARNPNYEILRTAKSITRGKEAGWQVGRSFVARSTGTHKLPGGALLDLKTGYIYRKVENPKKRGSKKQAAKKRNPKYVVEAIPKYASKVSEEVQAFTRGSAIRKVQRSVEGPKNAYRYRVEKVGNPKRRRNLDHRDSVHPIEVTKHWRQGPPGYMTPWQRAHAAGQQDLFNIKNPNKRKPAAKRRRNSSQAAQTGKEQFKDFHGFESTRGLNLRFPDGTPDPHGKSVLGKLVKLILTDGTEWIPVHKSTYLCRDRAGRLYLGTTADNLAMLPAGPQGVVKQVEYQTRKPALGHPDQTVFYHHLGEITGEKPTLYSDGKGGLSFRGGAYKITWRGIEN